MSADKPMLDIPDEVIGSLARTLLPAIQEYLESEDGQKEFAEWKVKWGNTTDKMAKAIRPE
jgi:hypothetical protein